MKLNGYRLVAFLLLIALSVGFGFLFDGVATLVEKNNYPIDVRYEQLITENAETFGIPPSVLWGFVSAQSDFESNLLSKDGRIGLMQLHPDTYLWICENLLKEEAGKPDILYAPATNLRCGAAYLSYLYGRYGVWDLTCAAYALGAQTVDSWLTDEQYKDEQGIFTEIPNKDAKAMAEKVAKAEKKYRKLYFTS